MTDYSAELAAFAARLEAEAEAVRDIFQYCLAMLQVERRQARLVAIELRDREPWCIFKTAQGEQFSLIRPPLTQTEESAMIELARGILYQKQDETLLSPLAGVEEEAPDETDTPPEVSPETAAPKKANRSSLSQADKTAKTLVQLIRQARLAAKNLQAVIEETRQVTAAARTAMLEQRLVLAELRSAGREYKRLNQQRHALPPFKHPTSDRDKQITLAILDGVNLAEAARTFNLSDGRIKQIHLKQLRRLYRLQEVLELSYEDLVAIRDQEQASLSRRQRPDAGKVKELLEKMWAYDES